jgi:CelD/BcsL family acetyltransferase involved in cellulose biosynthesis
MNKILHTVKTRIITSREELLLLAEAWNLLHIEVKGTIFQTFEWNASWWDIYKQDNYRLYVLTIWNEDILIGLVPFFHESYNFGIVKYSRLKFIGTTETYGEYTPLVHPRFEQEISNALFTFCNEQLQKNRCDVVLLFRFPHTSNFMKIFLSQIESDGIKVEYIPNSIPRVSMELPESWEKYLEGLSPNEKQMLLRRQRSIVKHGVELEKVINSSLLDKDYDDFIRLHIASWTNRGMLSYFSSKKFETFQRSIISQFRKEKIARLYFFKKNGVRFAAVQAFFINKVCCFYLSGLNRTHELIPYSPGKVLLSLVIKDAIEEGYKTFDFQGGAEDYKSRLGGKKTSFAKAYLWKPGIKTFKILPIHILIGFKQFIQSKMLDEIFLPFMRNIYRKIFTNQLWLVSL